MSCFSLHLPNSLPHPHTSRFLKPPLGLAQGGWVFHTPRGSEDRPSQKQAGQLDARLSMRVARQGDTGEGGVPGRKGEQPLPRGAF